MDALVQLADVSLNAEGKLVAIFDMVCAGRGTFVVANT